SVPPLHLPSFPTRRSSDLGVNVGIRADRLRLAADGIPFVLLLGRRILERAGVAPFARRPEIGRTEDALADGLLAHGQAEVNDTQDRKSTRLNSSHLGISYA